MAEIPHPSSPVLNEAINALKACANKCTDFILAYSDKNRAIQLFKAGSNSHKFDKYNTQLSRCLSQVGCAINIQGLIDVRDLKDSYIKNSQIIIEDIRAMHSKLQDFASQQVSTNESLNTIKAGNEHLINIIQQSVVGSLAELLESQSKLNKIYMKPKLLGNKSYKIRFDEIIFDNEIEVPQSSIKIYKGKLNGQPVTIKTFTDKSDVDKELLVREAEILSNLHCDRIINLLGACFEEAGSLMVLEAVENGSLDEVISGTLPFSAALKSRIANEITLGLHYLHTKKIFYKGLNPKSILFDRDWHVKLANFDRASAKKILSLPSVPLGPDIIWYAPEIVMGREHYDKAAADVYSLGLVLWSLFADKLPYASISRERGVFLMHISVNANRDSTAGIPKEFCEIIEGCWKSNPEDRLKMDEVVSKIQRLTLNTFMASEGAVAASLEKEYLASSEPGYQKFSPLALALALALAYARSRLSDYYRNGWGGITINQTKADQLSKTTPPASQGSSNLTPTPKR